MKKADLAKVQELLDSDDELPMEYFEEEVTPAYKNDHRFDMIQFRWINNATVPTESQIITNIAETGNKNMKLPIIKNGILSKNDLFCLKSLEGYGDSTLIWFVNFLIYKDLQSNYIFLRSCLVNNYVCDKVFNLGPEKSLKNSDNQYIVRY